MLENSQDLDGVVLVDELPADLLEKVSPNVRKIADDEYWAREITDGVAFSDSGSCS